MAFFYIFSYQVLYRVVPCTSELFVCLFVFFVLVVQLVFHNNNVVSLDLIHVSNGYVGWKDKGSC